MRQTGGLVDRGLGLQIAGPGPEVEQALRAHAHSVALPFGVQQDNRRAGDIILAVAPPFGRAVEHQIEFARRMAMGRIVDIRAEEQRAAARPVVGKLPTPAQQIHMGIAVEKRAA